MRLNIKSKLRRFFSSLNSFLTYALGIGSICLISSYMAIKIYAAQQDAAHIPIENFVFIEAEKQVFKACDDENCLQEETFWGEYRMLSSGVVISSIDDYDKTYILTAGHTCEAVVNPESGLPMPNQYYELGLSARSVITIQDYWGLYHDAEIVDYDMVSDLCLISSDEVWTDGSFLATIMPKRGERVFNTAAPSGIFSPMNVLILDGYYTGFDYVNDSYFTVPARPGSSGSPIYNRDGEIVALIHSAAMTFENLAIASDQEKIRAFLISHGVLIP